LKTQGQTDLPLNEVAAINERDYGDYTGKNKWEVKAEVGDEKFNAIRRNFDEPIPNGETLHMVYNRAVPWFKETVVPELEKGENVLLVGHGNSMRSLVKYIESISDDGISKFEMPLGMILEYTVDDNGKMTSRKELHVATGASKA
jgi:2,3-bisphosphoglycerate-dependent phosphoglycerate mutase